MSREIWLVVGILIMVSMILIVSSLLDQSVQNLQNFCLKFGFGSGVNGNNTLFDSFDSRNSGYSYRIRCLQQCCKSNKPVCSELNR